MYVAWQENGGEEAFLVGTTQESIPDAFQCLASVIITFIAVSGKRSHNALISWYITFITSAETSAL